MFRQASSPERDDAAYGLLFFTHHPRRETMLNYQDGGIIIKLEGLVIHSSLIIHHSH